MTMPRYILPFFLAAAFTFQANGMSAVPDVREMPAAGENSYADAPGRREPVKTMRGEPKPEEKARLRFEYDVDFDFRFDNREYDRSGFSPSMTIFGARLTPSVGLGIDDRRKSGRHSLMIGADIMKDFGDGKENAGLFREIVFYYEWVKRFRKTEMTLTAGIFPRSAMEGNYSTAFFSDSLKFYDNNIEGLLLRFRRPEAYYEIGCDWMGKYGGSRRERFMIFSSGEARPVGILRLGYSAVLYHLAGCEEVTGVVDNILLDPYVGLDFSGMAGIQELGFSLGWLQSFQNDRRNIGKYVFPHGGELVLNLKNWNAGIENRLFYGTDMMPYYNRTDAAGAKYGNLLYFGDPFFRVSEEHGGLGFYDRLDVFYEPRIAAFLTLRVCATLHFNEGFSGWQQTVALRFDLSALPRVKRRH